MKHVVIIGKYYPPEFGGVERYTQDVAHVAAKTHRVTVVVHNRERGDCIERDGDITIIRCGTAKTISSQPISMSMLRHLRSLKPDLVHFNAPNFWGAAMLLLVAYEAPLIIYHHADVFGRPFLKRVVMPIYRRIARRATCVMVSSFKNAAASRDLPSNVCCFVEMPFGIDSERYHVDDNKRAVLLAEREQRFGDAPVVGFVGRFVRYKALPVLIEAVSRVDALQALLIGDGPLRSEIEQRIHAAGITKRVHLLGDLDECSKIDAMGMMDMLVLPSNDITEAFGIVQVEAQLMGLPVIASRLPTGVSDVTLDEITGLLVPPNDPGALAAAFSRLLKDQMLAHRLGTAGRERALRLFNMRVFENRLSTLLHAALSGLSFDELAVPFLIPPDAPMSSPFKAAQQNVVSRQG